MAKKLFQRLMPAPGYIKAHPRLQFLGTWLEDPNLFHLNRYSVSAAFLVGVFLAFFPIPGQMMLAAIIALWVRCNLPIAITLVWITNPITIAPIFYGSYQLGCWILDMRPLSLPSQLSWEWVHSELAQVWKPLLTGSFCAGTGFSLLSYYCIRCLWRLQVSYQWRHRKAMRRKASD